MNENETSTEATPEITVNMYPSVKEQVTATALVSLVSIAIPLAGLGIIAAAGAAVTKAQDWWSNRKAKKEQSLLVYETPKND